MEFTHFDEQGNAWMVDVSEKENSERQALAIGRIYVCEEIMERIQNHTIKKGDVLNVARIAGIMGAKRCADLIPLCHILPLTKCQIDFECKENYIEATCLVKTVGKTGVEMEALTGVQIALLTIYDMCKAIDKSMEISNVHLVNKSGGKSGDFVWKES
ncbi:MAG: cyclic pyranopterin monophosphate synthase MoaC [Firmicutes bacterium]|nr:cyclic pyranopterin monophosphate synthase MoaC [Bacillota bacterium]